MINTKGGENTLNAPKMRVKCGVDNCQYNKDHMCYAHMLEVNSAGMDQPHTSDGTCCATFKESH